jgi:glycosyltransferase involved in cell wall biosynthesis
LSLRIAIISNSVTPYRIHLHRRIARECPDLQLCSIFTHEFSNAPWRLAVPPEIGPVFFGQGQESEKQGFLTKPWQEISKAIRIAKVLRRDGIESVVLFGYNDWCRIYLILWCRARRIPCFLFGDSNIQAEAMTGMKMRVKRALLPLFLRLCSGAMHCGRMGAAYFRLYGVSDEKLFPFPYEPDYELVAGVPEQVRQQAMADCGLLAARRRILYSGRLSPVKRVDLLILAFRSLAGERPDWDLIIAGDGPERARLAAQFEPALQCRVHFLGFINEPEKLAALYAACDALVLPSEFEPWGVVVTEAATRLALVCSSQVGAASDLVEDHHNGRTFQSGDAAALTEALREVTDPANIDRMKAASPRVLAAWRARTDPVLGLRRALRFAGLPLPLV